MAKRKSSRGRSSRQTGRKTNWTIIYAVVAGGIVLLGVLLFLSLQSGEIVTIEKRCEDEGAMCVAKGDASAPVTIIEILDFGCTHCRDFQNETEPLIDSEYVATGDVRFVVMPYALSGSTLPATNAALCANEQGAYFDYADALFAQYDSDNYLTRDSLISTGEAVGLEMTSFAACVDDGRYNSTITDNIDIARLNRVNSTPNFFVNGVQLEGAQPFSVFQQQIESNLN
ncbi:MAG: DsbA family protein [Anaerolineales bacterium]|nr:DsbA family protein [Anaerolineales bacterium]MCA9930191.1 DsbA family protein [Anaerolineales bacterium]